MSGFQSFAIAGPGNLGQQIAKSLLSYNKDSSTIAVRFLTRAWGRKSTELLDLGATYAEVDYDDHESLIRALSGSDVVISTVGAPGLITQFKLADASKAAGVKLFVPSEFGGSIDGCSDHPIFATKNQVKKHLQDIDLPFAVFYTGLFPDYVLKSTFKFDFKGRKVFFGGSGGAPISWTCLPDIGRFVPHALTTVPKEELKWRIFRIEGDRQSFNSLISSYEQRTGAKIKVTKRPRAQLEAALKENPTDFLTFLYVYWDIGGAASGKPEEICNDIWPEWNPRSAVDIAIEVNA
ncbi:NAD-P-binding protein [Schizopora paradoxa]|uniref:NAD-P-binding protein n=1 Tax=Schizopora paradoxa TaxID=27342 RepID=A0A0H2SBF9_9AGAM|nr:NAD-P-binding protein [Schizopora paradoxa]